MKSLTHKVYAGIELGGTKVKCGIADETGNLIAKTEFPTRSPEIVFNKIEEYFSILSKNYLILSLGIASFGPIEKRNSVSKFGYILETPKIGWNNIDIVSILKKKLQLPITFDTDVIAAAKAEYHWGNIKSSSLIVYITIGTGIGAGILKDGMAISDLIHPEMGHMRIPRIQKDTFIGACKFHKDCLEGLASGKAIEKRWNISPKLLPKGHECWDFETTYLAYGFLNLFYIVGPEVIILGGGIGNRDGIIDKVRDKMQVLSAGYGLTTIKSFKKVLIKPFWGKDSGLLGSIYIGASDLH